MMTCEQAREILAVDPSDEDTTLQQHLESCPLCAVYQRGSYALDVMLRAELRWEAPEHLTRNLLALAVMPSVVLAPHRPSGWRIRVIYALTLLIVVISLVIGSQIAWAFASQLGLFTMLNELFAAPARFLQQLTIAQPQSRYAIDLFLRIRDQMFWMLVAAVLWALVDRMSLQRISQRQRA